MQIKSNAAVIHIFALLHCAAALVCRIVDMPDDLILSLLTMLLVVLICFRKQSGAVFMVSSVVLANIIGLILGKGVASLLQLFLQSPLAVYPLSTLACTETIGWTVLLLASLLSRRHPVTKGDFSSKKSLIWLFSAFVTIIIVRLVIVLRTSDFEIQRNALIGILLDYVCSCGALIWVAVEAIKSQKNAQKAETEAELAQYRYLKLKQQVNPHFLFNSLNVLDSLIQEQSSAEASDFTHKLAEIYRYMIVNEDEKLVELRDEMKFVEQYVDLLKVRWPEGLEITDEMDAAAMGRHVVPCCIQLLIENATKHNAVSPSKPLVISIRTSPESIIVTNNIRPKKTRSNSTGLGLKYIRQQYRDVADKEVCVTQTDESFTVTLPLL